MSNGKAIEAEALKLALSDTLECLLQMEIGNQMELALWVRLITGTMYLITFVACSRNYIPALTHLDSHEDFSFLCGVLPGNLFLGY